MAIRFSLFCWSGIMVVKFIKRCSISAAGSFCIPFAIISVCYADETSKLANWYMLLSVCVYRERSAHASKLMRLWARIWINVYTAECAPATAFLSYFLSSGEVLQIDKCDHVGSMVGGRRTRSAHQTYSHLNEHTSAAFKRFARSLLFSTHTFTDWCDI